MAVVGDLLFWSRMDQAGLSDVLRHNLETEVPRKVGAVPSARFGAESDEQLIASVVADMRCNPIRLRLDESDADVRETTVTVRDVFHDQVTVPGLRITKLIPFDGEEALFRLRPDTWGMNPPRGEIRRGRLAVGMEVRQHESEAAMRYIEEAIASVGECIAYQRPLIDGYNAGLEGAVGSAVAGRRRTLGTASDIAARLRGR